MFVKWSFTNLLAKKTRFTFLNQLPLSYEIDQTCGCCKERYKGYEEWLKCKLCDHEAYMKLALKSNQHLLRSFSLFCSKVFIFI